MYYLKEITFPSLKTPSQLNLTASLVVMEVASHMGNRVVRCIVLDSSEGLAKGMEVTATGDYIKVPVGESTLGRMFNVVGETIDGGEPVKGEEQWPIHREPPAFDEQNSGSRDT